jgi:hypothetical protein
MGFLDDALERQRQRQDPLGRLPWPVKLLGLVLAVALGVAQVAVGRLLFGLLLLVVVVPPLAVATWATWKVGQER